MAIDRWIGAALLGLGLTLTPAGPASSQALRVMEGTAAADLRVPVSRAVVVETEQPFAELSIANPDIADISSLSDSTIYVLGKAPGRTTLTLLDPEGRLITNVEVQVTPDIAEFKERLRPDPAGRADRGAHRQRRHRPVGHGVVDRERSTAR